MKLTTVVFLLLLVFTQEAGADTPKWVSYCKTQTDTHPIGCLLERVTKDQVYVITPGEDHSKEVLLGEAWWGDCDSVTLTTAVLAWRYDFGIAVAFYNCEGPYGGDTRHSIVGIGDVFVDSIGRVSSSLDFKGCKMSNNLMHSLDNASW